MSEYITNKETGKLELHFDKEDYINLPDEQKKQIKSNFLFSRYSKAWVSRCKWPNLYRAEQVAKSLGLENGGETGERLSFEEQQNVKAEKAERRAERFDNRSDKAYEESERLKKPFREHHGDIAFFTQPNINTSGGRAFTRYRERVFASFDKGMEAFQKSEYYKERAEIARETMKNATAPDDKSFCQRRIDDAEKVIRAQRRNLEDYKKMLEKIENGGTVTRYNGDIITADEIRGWIERAEEIIEAEFSKVVYYQECIEKLGGIKFSKENLKPGYIIKVDYWRGPLTGRIITTGTKNVTIKTEDGTKRWVAYSNILELVRIPDKDEQPEILHPFKVGDEYTIQVWNTEKGYVDKVYKVTKITADKVTVKSGTEKAKAVTVRSYREGEYTLPIDKDSRYGYITKKAEQTA